MRSCACDAVMPSLIEAGTVDHGFTTAIGNLVEEPPALGVKVG